MTDKVETPRPALRAEKVFRDRVSEKGEKYHRDCLRFFQELNRSNARYHGEVVDTLYQPMFFDMEDYRQFEKCAASITDIAVKLADAYRGRGEIRSLFGFDPVMDELVRIDPGYSHPAPMARIDLFHSRSGSYRFCEFNTDGTSGMNETQELERIFSRTEIFGELQSRFSFRRQELIGTWVDCMLDLYAEFGGHGEPVFAITDWEGSGVREEFSAVQEEIRRRGLTCAIADPRSFRYRGRRLIADGLPVDILYRRAVNFECAQRAEEIGPLIRAYKDGAVCMIGPFTSQILHNKTVFWILRRPEVLALFTEEERRFVEDHVPLTMKLSDDRRVIDFARCSRESLVLKPADRYAARDVFAGRDLTDGEWKSLLEEKSGEGGFLLQEFCDSGLMPLLGGDERGFSELNCRNVLGLYMYDGVFRGVYTRVGISSIIASVWKCKILPGLFIQKAYEK